MCSLKTISSEGTALKIFIEAIVCRLLRQYAEAQRYLSRSYHPAGGSLHHAGAPARGASRCASAHKKHWYVRASVPALRLDRLCLRGLLHAAALGRGRCGGIGGWPGVIVSSRCGRFMDSARVQSRWRPARSYTGGLALAPAKLVDPANDLDSCVLIQMLVHKFGLCAPGDDLMALGLLVLLTIVIGPVLLGYRLKLGRRARPYRG
jgi:hypothetical protein